jgi:endonuclease YncB( thermonuclease family)
VTRLTWALAGCAAAALVAVSALTGGSDARVAGSSSTVRRVIDGDTIVMSSGVHVRLVQIDATELGSGECYSRKAASVLRSLLPPGTPVRLEADPALDSTDRYGRLLRYVHKGALNVNLELVWRGAATVWFYQGERGRYAGKLLAAARSARAARRGIWGSCRVVWNPNGPATAFGGGSPGAGSGGGQSRGACNPNYSPCLPIVDDLDCNQIGESLKPIHVIGGDPYGLDGDHDGLGCEGSSRRPQPA